ncbi:hypothetical protein H0H87_007577 [Tephrocybe sp. NHM501043]|nr:hypothetical protein H0H87_007577 [Tephrocybe sp. NHM501043]
MAAPASQGTKAMLFNLKTINCIVALTLPLSVIAAPIESDALTLSSRANDNVQHHVLSRSQAAAPESSKPPGGPPPIYDDPTSKYRAQNADPNRVVPDTCKKVADCKCPAASGPGMRSTSCINGFCKCNDSTIHAVAGKFLDAVAAIGNAPITKAVSNLMKGLATIKDVAGTIVGAVLPPHLRQALKVALNALPNTGPSFLDDAKKKVLTAGL